MAAAAESNRARCVDVPRGKDATPMTTTTTTTTEKEDATAPRRRLEYYRFRSADLLYYALSVSFFFADVATGEQRVLPQHTHAHVKRMQYGVSRDFATTMTGVKFSS